jgi:hypothetical protein
MKEHADVTFRTCAELKSGRMDSMSQPLGAVPMDALPIKCKGQGARWWTAVDSDRVRTSRSVWMAASASPGSHSGLTTA